MNIYYHPRFRRSFRNLENQVKAQVEESIALFR